MRRVKVGWDEVRVVVGLPMHPLIALFQFPTPSALLRLLLLSISNLPLPLEILS